MQATTEGSVSRRDFRGVNVATQTVWNDMSGEISAELSGPELKGHAERVTAYDARVTSE
jgi:hypothetical protein